MVVERVRGQGGREVSVTTNNTRASYLLRLIWINGIFGFLEKYIPWNMRPRHGGQELETL